MTQGDVITVSKLRRTLMGILEATVGTCGRKPWEADVVRKEGLLKAFFSDCESNI